MSGAQEVAVCSGCKEEKPVLRKYYYYPIDCDCCNGNNHFEYVYHCDNCIPTPPETITARVKHVYKKEIVSSALGLDSADTSRQAWFPFGDINFLDERIEQIHVDTRDFNCLVSKQKFLLMPQYIHVLDKKEEYFYSPEEVTELLEDLQSKSGGKKDWRFFALKKKNCGGQITYIRFYKTPHGFVTQANGDKIKPKEFWRTEYDDKAWIA